MHKTQTICYIDLEQTILESWQDPLLINVSKIRDFLKERQITEVSIFSYAIYNDNDKRIFADQIKPNIERALGVTVMGWPSVQDMIREEKKYTGIVFDQAYEVAEYIQLRGKKDGFINYVQGTCDFETAILIDDVVPDLTLSHRFKGWSIELWNVDSLGKTK